MNELLKKPGLPSDKVVMIIYLLYLAGLVIPITHVIGVVMAYLYRNEAPSWLQSHFAYQIRTFWIALASVLVGALLLKVKIGALLLLLLLVWLIIRCIKGLKLLDQQSAHPNPQGWLF